MFRKQRFKRQNWKLADYLQSENISYMKDLPEHEKEVLIKGLTILKNRAIQESKIIREKNEYDIDNHRYNFQLGREYGHKEAAQELEWAINLLKGRYRY